MLALKPLNRQSKSRATDAGPEGRTIRLAGAVQPPAARAPLGELGRPCRTQRPGDYMPARNASLSLPTDRGYAGVFRNLLLYALLFNLFASQAAGLFSEASESGASVVSDAGNLYNQLLLPAAFLAAWILVLAHRVPIRVLSAAFIPMAPLLLMMAFSAVWSDYPELTIRRASHEIIEATTMALVAICFSTSRAVLKIFFRAFFVIGLLDLLSAAVFPDSFTVKGFAGIHSDKNIAGQFFFVALPIYLFGTVYKDISGSRWLGLFSLVSGVAMLVLTQSKTAIGATPAGLLVVLLMHGLCHRNSSVRAAMTLCCLAGLLSAVAALMTWGVDDVLEMLVRDPTLTGRDLIWQYANSKFQGSPIVGVGYGAIWQVGPQIEAALKRVGLFFVFNEAHNGYLEIAAQLGSAGVVCLAIFLMATLVNILSYWTKIERNRFYGTGAFTIYIFWGLVIFNITESLYFQSGIGNSNVLIFLGAFVASLNKRSSLVSIRTSTVDPARSPIVRPVALTRRQLQA